MSLFLGGQSKQVGFYDEPCCCNCASANIATLTQAKPSSVKFHPVYWRAFGMGEIVGRPHFLSERAYRGPTVGVLCHHVVINRPARDLISRFRLLAVFVQPVSHICIHSTVDWLAVGDDRRVSLFFFSRNPNKQHSRCISQ